MASIKDEETNCRYLEEMNFQKTLPKLVKKLEGKKVVIYGAGSYFQCIIKNYDISGLNIIGIADRTSFVYNSNDLEALIKRYYNHAGLHISGITDQHNDFDESRLENIKICGIEELKNHDVDYILVSLRNYVPVLENLYEKFKGTKIKVKPLVKIPIFEMLKEL